MTDTDTLRFSKTVPALDNTVEAIERAMGVCWQLNAQGEDWAGDVWGLLNQASGKVDTAAEMMRVEGGWDALETPPDPYEDPAETALQEAMPPDFEGVPKRDVFVIAWRQAIRWSRGARP